MASNLKNPNSGVYLFVIAPVNVVFILDMVHDSCRQRNDNLRCVGADERSLVSIKSQWVAKVSLIINVNNSPSKLPPINLIVHHPSARLFSPGSTFPPSWHLLGYLLTPRPGPAVSAAGTLPPPSRRCHGRVSVSCVRGFSWEIQTIALT